MTRAFKNYKPIVIAFFVLRCVNGMAQDTINSATVEQKSYQLYLDKNWDELIKYGNKAVGKGVDYFYLEIRIGIAYYEKKNYRVAEKHFSKALSFNSEDELAKEYLYYCYVFAGKYDEARSFSKTFSTTLAKKVGTDEASSLNFVIAEGGIKKADSSELFKNATYFQLGVGHSLDNTVSLFHAITYFSQEDFRGKTTQFQYYLNANATLKKGWSISPAIHWLNKSYTPNILPPPVTGMGLQPRPRPAKPIKTNYFVGSLAIKKNIGRFDITLGNTVSNIDSATQYIHSLSFTYFPLGNNRLSLNGTYYIHTENSYSDLNSALSATLVVAPVNKLSISLNYFYNNGTNNIIESNGYIVNNSFGPTRSRYSAMATVAVTHHLSIYGLYQFENKEEPIKDFNYYYNVFIVGFKIIP